MYKWNLVGSVFITKSFDKIGLFVFFHPDIPIKQKKDDPLYQYWKNACLLHVRWTGGEKGVRPWD
jgi:hypothetical protein